MKVQLKTPTSTFEMLWETANKRGRSVTLTRPRLMALMQDYATMVHALREVHVEVDTSDPVGPKEHYLNASKGGE